jgi:hypothetical protein
MSKTFAAKSVVCALLIATAFPVPARAMDPWTAALFWIGGIYVGSLYGMPYAYGGGAYRGAPYAMPPAYGYPPPYAYPAPAAYAPPPPPPPGYEGRNDKSPDRCMPATMLIDGAERQVRICY